MRNLKEHYKRSDIMADIKKNNRLRDKKIDILKQVRGYDEYGEPIDELQTIAANIWAYYRQVSGSEFFQL